MTIRRLQLSIRRPHIVIRLLHVAIRHPYMDIRPEPDLAGFAHAFYAYFASLEGVYRSAAISVIRTAQMEPLAQLAREINPQLSQTQADNIQYYDRKGKPHLFFDLGDWLHTAAKTPEQHARIDETLARAVIFKRHTDKLINIDIKRHSGLSVYIPQAELPWLNKAYKKTEWARIAKSEEQGAKNQDKVGESVHHPRLRSFNRCFLTSA